MQKTVFLPRNKTIKRLFINDVRTKSQKIDPLSFSLVSKMSALDNLLLTVDVSLTKWISPIN